jgi:GNAT superfamily N-acetyltransferase
MQGVDPHMRQRASQSPLPRRLLIIGESDVNALCAILMDCVAEDASVGFLHPVSPQRARAYWLEVKAKVEQGDVALLVMDDDHGIVGTVQLILQQPENQAHRAHVAKLLVHSRGRRRGIGTALMAATEELALSLQKSLIDLDTAVGPSEVFYQRLGWSILGTVPGYALSGHGVPCDYRFFYRRLA